LPILNGRRLPTWPMQSLFTVRRFSTPDFECL
jgi:hypothetical protein